LSRIPQDEEDLTMQVTADVDCTPEEARVFLGVPDVRPLQAAVMAHMQERMLAEADRFSPERLMKAWMSLFGRAPPPASSRTKRDVPKGSEPTP
jgi:hypothetical protein